MNNFKKLRQKMGLLLDNTNKSFNINIFHCVNKFHSNYITQFKISECPICKQRKKKKIKKILNNMAYSKWFIA